MEVTAIIPARLSSTRFPGKVLYKIGGKTILQHVYERVSLSKRVDDVFIATAEDEIIEEVKSFNGKFIRTTNAHPSGTSRVAEAVSNLSSDIILNVQADEPLISPSLLDQLVEEAFMEDIQIVTPVKKIERKDEIGDPNVVKVVFDKELNALYFSRHPIPYDGEEFYKHIGVYCFKREVLLAYPKLTPSPLEEFEKLEQLRFLWNGYKIKVLITQYESFGVDTPQDLEKIRKFLNGED